MEPVEVPTRLAGGEIDRAWMDPISNVIRPRGVILRRDLGKLHSSRSWPETMIQPFIHELTHHWCFHSELGAVLAHIRFRMIRRGLAGKVNILEFLDDYLTVDTVLTLLRPLSEGLALFAEYDMLPGSSRAASTPMMFSAIALSDLNESTQQDIDERLADTRTKLLTLRLGRASIDRKLGFLLDPLTPLERCYFDGYLMVKRVYADLLKAAPAFRDTDLFLVYLRSFFFLDSGLIALLGKKFENPFARQVAIIEHFQKRMNQLYLPNLAEEVNELERNVDLAPGASSDAQLSGLPGLRLSGRDRRSAKTVLDNIRDEIADDEQVSDLERRILDLQRGWFSRRSLAQIAVEPMRVAVTGGRVAVWPDPEDHELPLIALPALDEAPKTKGRVSGWATVVLQPVTGHLVTVVGIESTSVALLRSPSGEIDSDLLDLLLDPVASPPMIEMEQQQIYLWLDEWLTSLPEHAEKCISDTRSSVSSASRRVCDAFLDRWAPDRRDPSFAERTRERGLWNVFERDETVLETFAVLAMLHDEDPLLPSRAAWMKDHGWDAAAALLVATRIEAQTGAAFVRNEDGVFRWLL